MKRSPSFSSSNSCFVSSPSSSSSSCEAPQIVSAEKPRAKRVRKHRNNDQNGSLDNAANNNNNGRRSSIYRGVTRHRWTGRFEAHLWDKSSWNNIQSKKGRQVYLGAYDSEDAAARTYDLAALKYWGPETILNFPKETYEKDMEEMKKVTKEEYLASLRRRSSGFSRGVSKYRGVARHHHNGRWEARIGRVFGNKYLYLGTFNTQEEAAAAYDMAALEYRGTNAVTNFDISHYIERLKAKGILIRIPDSGEAQRPESGESEQMQPPQQQVQQEKQEQEPKLQASASASERSQHFQDMQRQLPPCIDSPTTTLAGIEPTDSNELAWSFAMDSGFSSFMVSDIPLNGTSELPNLFDHDTGFEDNFDLLFDVGPPNVEEEANQKCVSDDAIFDVGVFLNTEQDNRKDGLSSPSSDSPHSSTTSVSCNYSV